METDIENIANLVGGISIVGDAPQDHGQGLLRSHLASIQDAIQMLVQSTETISSQARYIKSVADNAKSSGNLPITEICSLHQETNKLAIIATYLTTTLDALNEATESSVIVHLKSLGTQNARTMLERQPPIPELFSHFDKKIRNIIRERPIRELFSHFDKKIRNIIREVLKNTSDQSMLWKIAEECYNQAASPSGILHADDYFDPIDAEYYEHENRLVVDEGYARSFRAQTERREQASRQDRQNWIDFWFRVLSNAPSGPTLFYPPTSFNNRSLNFDAVPQYLFRTFDEDSSGRNDESVIASIASVLEPQGSSRVDLLALETHQAAELLHMHLTKGPFGGEKSDNLMSWTSSLLFAIQYAVWRCQFRGCRRSDIKICAVDTTKFPQGQLARDTWLFKTCISTARGEDPTLTPEDPAQNFFKFRLKDARFYNGEYLSQGAVNHANRSCVVSLEDLIQSGLYELYPEFEDATGSEKWAKGVLELRQNWSAEQRTTTQEIHLALQIARNCFSRFSRVDIASILLTFKNRRHSRLSSINTPNNSNKQPPEWADKPVEVRRYWIATEAAKSCNASPLAGGPYIGQPMLREIFEQP